MLKKLIPFVLAAFVSACAISPAGVTSDSGKLPCCEKCECCNSGTCKEYCSKGKCACCKDGMCKTCMKGAQSKKEDCPACAKAEQEWKKTHPATP